MLWFWLSLIHPLFFSFSNVVDQVLVRKYFAASIPGYFILVGLAVPPMMLVFFGLYPSVLDVTWQNALFLNMIGILYIGFVYPYCHAIKNDDATVVVPIFHLAPVFVYIIGLLTLGETLSSLRLTGGALIVFASVLIVWDFEMKRFRWKTLALMIISTFIYAVMNITLRLAGEFEWYVTIFWMMPAWIEAMLIFTVLRPGAFKEVISSIKTTRGMPYFLMLFAGTTDTIAIASMAAAIAIAPATALVSVVGGTQPLMLIVTSGLAAFIWPDLIQKIKLGKAFVLKITCCVLILLGLFLILSEEADFTFG